jgi:hypothetical protein
MFWIVETTSGQVCFWGRNADEARRAALRHGYIPTGEVYRSR